MRRMNDEQWLSVLQECRSSGLTDKAWCTMHDIHPTSFYRAVKRLREKSCTIPTRSTSTTSLLQEVVEVATVDENGIITRPCRIETTPTKCAEKSISHYDNSISSTVFEASARITTTSGITVELSNNTNAATIKSIIGALQSV